MFDMPTILVHEIGDQPFVSYDDFVRHVRRFPPYHLLQACHEIAIDMDGKSRPDTWVFAPEQYGGKAGERVYLYPAMLPFIAKTSLLHSADYMGAPPTPDDIRGLVYLYANLIEGNDAEEHKRGRSILMRLEWEQFIFERNVAREIPRAKLIFVDENQATGAAGLDIDEYWTNLTGLSLEKFIMLGFAYWAGSLKHARLWKYFPSRGVLDKTFNENDCQRFLDRAAATYEKFRDLSAPFLATDRSFAKTELNMLLQRPLIEVGQEVLIPTPFLLVRRFSEGLFVDIRDSFESPGERGTFMRNFGALFEAYVGRLLRMAFGAEHVYKEPVYYKKKQEFRGFDWTVIDGDTAYLIECRSTQFNLETRVYGRPSEISKDLSDMFAKTVSRLPRKVADLSGGSVTGVDLSGVTRFIPMVVLYEHVIQDAVFKELVAEAFEEAGEQPPTDYHLINIEDFETLLAWQPHHSMKEVLGQFNSDGNISDFIVEYSRTNQLGRTHPLLQDELNAMFERIGVLDSMSGATTSI